jgi:hypothetical protein
VVFIGVLQLRERFDLERADQFVRDQQAFHAEAQGDTRLGERGHGDAPGAGLELARIELRAHRGFAVRREAHIGAIHIRLEAAQIVAQRGGLEQRHGCRQIAPEQIPALRAEFADAQRRRARRQAFAGDRNGRIENGGKVEFHRSRR